MNSIFLLTKCDFDMGPIGFLGFVSHFPYGFKAFPIGCPITTIRYIPATSSANKKAKTR
jgi:hypothetical protein